MYYNKMKTFGLLFMFMVISIAVSAQVNKDTASVADAIVRVDGSIIYGKVIEVNQDVVKYRINDMSKGPVITLTRKLVYAISYSNSTTQIITPKFGNKRINDLAYDQDRLDIDNYSSDSTNFLMHNITHGAFKVGIGFSREYSSLKGVNDFTRATSAPAMFVGYDFRFNRFLLLGASIGFASYNYKYLYSSDYDQLDINQKINESITTLGVYGRYNIMDGFIKPYLLMGLNFNYSSADLVGDIFFRNEAKHVATNSGVRGLKTDFVFRGGVDFLLSKRFGLYTDIGSGTSLIQMGVIFNLK